MGKHALFTREETTIQGESIKQGCNEKNQCRQEGRKQFEGEKSVIRGRGGDQINRQKAKTKRVKRQYLVNFTLAPTDVVDVGAVLVGDGRQTYRPRWP